MKLSNSLMIGLAIAFFVLGYNALQESQSVYKSPRIYKELQNYIPYYLEQRVGGYSIRSKLTDVKEKPSATEVFKRLEQLERMWGKEFLKLEDKAVIVLDKNGTQIGKIPFHLPEEKQWVKSFFKLEVK